MRVLLIGGGGREHALAWKLAQSRQLETLFIAPGNPGTATIGTNVVLDLADHHGVALFCAVQGVRLVVIGPEAPLVDGLADSLRAKAIAVFGPSAAAAQLEGSKGFTKALCAEHAIPTADYAHFNSAADARAHVMAQGAPIVIKADGLAAGKGVTVAQSVDEALAAVDACFADDDGSGGTSVVIEECLVGPEISFFCLCDGESALPLLSAQDHKRVGDGDTGPNTGGMGAFAPSPLFTPGLQRAVMDEIIEPTLAAMRARQTPFTGVLYAGLMLTAKGLKLIEYNVRFGDPECQALMMLLDSDLLALLHAAATGRLNGQDLRWKDAHAVTIVHCAPGYPGTPQKGSVIRGLEKMRGMPSTMVFQAGTAMNGSDLVANGGRVLNVTATGDTLAAARRAAYAASEMIDWPDGFYRSDIAGRSA